MRLPLARHRGPTRFAPQARKRSWPKVTTHMAGARSQADLASWCRRAPASMFVQGGKAVPAVSPPQRD